MKPALLLLLTLAACTTKPESHTPIGDSMIAGPFVATLVESMEFRIPEVSGRGQDDRYKLALLLHSLDGKTRRTVPIKSGLRANEFMHAARLLEDDGQRLFFHAHEPLAYNYSTGNLSIANAPHHRPRSTPSPKDFRGNAEAICKDCKRPSLLLQTPNGPPTKTNQPGKPTPPPPFQPPPLRHRTTLPRHTRRKPALDRRHQPARRRSNHPLPHPHRLHRP